jgi:hypothetical protein
MRKSFTVCTCCLVQHVQNIFESAFSSGGDLSIVIKLLDSVLNKHENQTRQTRDLVEYTDCLSMRFAYSTYDMLSKMYLLIMAVVFPVNNLHPLRSALQEFCLKS